ncbi:MAG: alpha/beta hydrolase [Caulobacter sp.]
MSDAFEPSRRWMLSAVAFTASAAPILAAAPAWSASSTGSPRTFAAVKQVKAGMLDVGYIDEGPSNGPVVLLLHGWPYDVHSFADVTPMLTAKGYRVIIPHLRGFGSTRFLSPSALRNAQQAALAQDALDLLDALQIEKALVAGYDWGARTAAILAAVWPERCTGLVAVSGYLVLDRSVAGKPLPPQAELQWWYQFYFATERGALGYAQNTHAFAKLIWKLASPQWRFDDATFARSALALDNPDHVAITIHNYRWRQGLADGEAQYGALEAKLAALPPIAVPTITIEGDANGAPHPDPANYRKRFTGRYEHRLLTGGVGHNPPQERPAEFAKAIFDLATA